MGPGEVHVRGDEAHRFVFIILSDLRNTTDSFLSSTVNVTNTQVRFRWDRQKIFSYQNSQGRKK